ncbi:MAG: DNA/RNA non-specific endonuclease [Bacteroidaceae bacterium]|nr:DNA/RNA non-specific endonuclease [Bacteroidaceae bacterium]
MTRKSKSHKNRRTKPTKYVQLVILVIFITAVGYVMNMVGCESVKTVGTTKYNGELVSQHIQDLDMARTAKGRSSQIIRHKGYTLSYNNEWRLANWVGYELTRDETDGSVERTDWFDEDPMVKGVKVRHADYTHSGFDRGHMAPAADMKWDKQAMVESFYMSNICPQVHALNAGLWNTLENRVRTWARRDSAIVVVCGPIVPREYMTIGENRVAVPEYFYKAIVSPYSTSPQGVAFIMPNEDIDEPLYKYAVTIDSVETVTGIDFFYNLPDSLENYIEQNINLKSWQL